MYVLNLNNDLDLFVLTYFMNPFEMTVVAQHTIHKSISNPIDNLRIHFLSNSWVSNPRLRAGYELLTR